MNLDSFLNGQRVPFERLHHRPAYTANHIAQSLHVPGRQMAKTVLLRTGHGYVMAVLPATCQVDMDRLREDLGEDRMELATEREMEQIFPDCERGAMPPFGSQYHLETVVDDSLAGDAIVFEGQNHQEAIRMAYRDYQAVEHPRMAHFARRM